MPGDMGHGMDVESSSFLVAIPGLLILSAIGYGVFRLIQLLLSHYRSM